MVAEPAHLGIHPGPKAKICLSSAALTSSKSQNHLNSLQIIGTELHVLCSFKDGITADRHYCTFR
jgi:hypothetical protein